MIICNFEYKYGHKFLHKILTCGDQMIKVTIFTLMTIYLNKFHVF